MFQKLYHLMSISKLYQQNKINPLAKRGNSIHALLPGQKFTPTPIFLVRAVAYFVGHISQFF